MATVKQNPGLLDTLLPLEEQFKAEWPYVPGQAVPHDEVTKEELESQDLEKRTLLSMAKKAAADELKTETMQDESGRPRYEESWVGSIIHHLIG